MADADQDWMSKGASTPLLTPRSQRTSSFQIAVLLLAIFLKGGVLGAYLPFSSLWISEQGYSNTQLGIVSAVDAFFCFLLPCVGALLDKLRSHNLGFVLILVTVTILKLLYLHFAKSFMMILVLTALTAPLLRASNSMLDALALYAMDRGSFPRIRLIGDLGWGCIALAVGHAMDVAGTVDVVYWFFASACGLLTVIWICALPLMENIRKDSEPMSITEYRAQFLCLNQMIDFGSIRALALLCFAGAGIGVISGFELVLLKELGASGLLLGIAKGMGTIISIPIWWVTTPLLDRFGIHNCQLLCLSCIVVRLVLLGYLRNPWHVLISESLAGIGGFPLIYGSITVYFGRLVSEDLKGTAQTLIYVVFSGIGAGLSPLVGGVYAETVGLQYMFSTAAALLSGVCICFALCDSAYGFKMMLMKSKSFKSTSDDHS